MAKYDLAAIRPVGDRVIVRRDAAASSSPGGIALPDDARPCPRMGTVMAIGPGAVRMMPSDGQDRYPMQCKVGDRVLLPHLAEVIRLDPADVSTEIVVCQENQILAIL